MPQCFLYVWVTGENGESVQPVPYLSIFFSGILFIIPVCVCVYESVSITSQCARNKDLSNAFI